MAKLLVRHKGTVHELEICYSAAQAAELLGRWPDGVIELRKIFDHDSPSTPRARAFIANAVFALVGEPLIAPAPFGFGPRDAEEARLVADARAALERSYAEQ
jgi:hypothetical protein